MVVISFEVLTIGKGKAVSVLVMMELRFRSIITSALEGGEWQTHALTALPPGRRPCVALNMRAGVPRNQSERDSGKVRNIVTGVSDGMSMSEMTKNFKSVIDKRRETLVNVRLHMQGKTWIICETWGFYGGLGEGSRLEEYEVVSDFQDF
jgi:hypothetical protein